MTHINQKPRYKFGVNFAPRARLELATLRLTAGCSTIELSRNLVFIFPSTLRLTSRLCRESPLSYRGIYILYFSSNLHIDFIGIHFISPRETLPLHFSQRLINL